MTSPSKPSRTYKFRKLLLKPLKTFQILSSTPPPLPLCNTKSQLSCTTVLFFTDIVLLCCPSSPQPHGPPTSAFPVLGLQHQPPSQPHLQYFPASSSCGKFVYFWQKFLLVVFSEVREGSRLDLRGLGGGSKEASRAPCASGFLPGSSLSALAIVQTQYARAPL